LPNAGYPPAGREWFDKDGTIATVGPNRLESWLTPGGLPPPAPRRPLSTVIRALTEFAGPALAVYERCSQNSGMLFPGPPIEIDSNELLSGVTARK
jgi:hypothetical protein